MIVTQTPLRLSLLGGNTDFPSFYEKHGGLVLTTTIDKYIYCIVKDRYDNLIKVNYSQKEAVTNIDDLEHEIVRECLRRLGITKSIEITYLSDIPSEGSGLGSSSAVTVGTLLALHRYKGENVSSVELAEEACFIERDILKKPIGVQDQYAVALGGLRSIELPYRGSGRIKLESHARESINNGLMLFFTNQTRQSSDILSKINLDEKILKANVKLAEEGEYDLWGGDIESFGVLLNKYWGMKKKLSDGVSNTIIDQMYYEAMRSGAYGGKIVGAGGGGFLLLAVPEDYRDSIRIGLSGHKELPFRITDTGSRVVYES